jgi:phosphoglucomutase/phosphopentomutase
VSVLQNEETKEEIRSLCLSKDVAKLRKLLLTRLKFGTAGLRGQMGPGYSQMNDLVIIQTAQGLTAYLEETLEDVIYKSGIVIGYDGRHNSRR